MINNLPPLYLEALNGTLFFFFLCIMFTFIRFVFNNVLRHGWRVGYQRSSTSIAFLVFLTGDAIIRSSIWAIRLLNNMHIDVRDNIDILLTGYALNIGLVIVLIGGICVQREIATNHCGWRSWVISATLSLAFGFGVAFLHG